MQKFIVLSFILLLGQTSFADTTIRNPLDVIPMDSVASLDEKLTEEGVLLLNYINFRLELLDKKIPVDPFVFSKSELTVGEALKVISDRLRVLTTHDVDLFAYNESAITTQEGFAKCGEAFRSLESVSGVIDGLSTHRIARATYDFDEHGGTQGAIGLSIILPENAILNRAWYEVLTTLESSSDAATIALHVEGANDIVTATAISGGGNIWDAGKFATIIDDTVGTFVRTSSRRELTTTIAVEDVTAGKFVMFAEYVISDPIPVP